MTTTSESAVKANISEAQALYQRGVAAARAGQKRLAAVLLTRSLQLDPRCEMAWLWLSGVIDNPRQQAFCLESVLKLNPANQHAQRGLRLLQPQLANGVEPLPTPGLELPAVAPSEPVPEAHREAWWVGWRRSRHEMSRARLLIWAFPIALVCLALLLYESFAIALGRIQVPELPAEVVYSAEVPTAEPSRATFEPILEAEPLAVVEGLTVSYLDAMEPIRVNLRAATESYRKTTSQPGGSGASVGHVAATQRLLAEIERAAGSIDRLNPPGTLQPAHADYLRGLELQRDGLDALLEFYSGYEVANANRAALRFQEARAYIERAQTAFAGQARQLAELSAMAAQTAR
jgi:hypothetical protein